MCASLNECEENTLEKENASMYLQKQKLWNVCTYNTWKT